MWLLAAAAVAAISNASRLMQQCTPHQKRTTGAQERLSRFKPLLCTKRRIEGFQERKGKPLIGLCKHQTEQARIKACPQNDGMQLHLLIGKQELQLTWGLMWPCLSAAFSNAYCSSKPSVISCTDRHPSALASLQPPRNLL